MPETPLRLLVVDDDPAMGTMVHRLLKAHGYPEPRVVMTGGAALESGEPCDIVLLDHQLPDVTGLEILASLRARDGRPSIILITGNGDEALAASALREGADDYLVKDQSLPTLLPQVIERVRRTRALRDALAAAEADLVQAERLAAIGQLTVTLHHEINNPLMSASVEVELMLERITAREERESLESIRDSLGRIRDVVKRVSALEEARARSYVGDVGMIDINAAPAPAPRVISRGDAWLLLSDEDLARVVSLLLRHAGFTVRRAGDTAGLSREAGKPGVRLVVIESTGVPGQPALAGFRPATDHRYTLVALVRGDGAGERAAGAGHTVTLPFDPGSFTEEILRAIEHRITNRA
jgi:DNA-binding response OmpR family regulator